MKKIYSILLGAALMLIGSQAYAQLAVGAGYYNATDKIHATMLGTEYNETSSLNGAYVGATYEIDLSSVTEGLGFEPGLNALLGFGKEGDANRTDIALQLPLNFKYSYELDGDLKIFGLAGPALQFGLINKDKEENGGVTVTTNYYDPDFAQQLSRFNVLLGLGAGIEFGGKFQIRFGYEFGLLPLYNENDFKVTRPGQLKFGVASVMF